MQLFQNSIFPYTGAQNSSIITGTEFGGGWGATCLSGNQRATAKPGSAQRCCPWAGWDRRAGDVANFDFILIQWKLL